MSVISCITTQHNPWLVLLSVIVCIVGAWFTVDLIRRARERDGFQKSGWIFLSAVIFGCSAWSTHFIAMLAYDVHAPIAYDPLLTLSSLLIAIAGAAAGLILVLRQDLAGGAAMGGAVIGLAVAAMHYAGVRAYHVDGLIEWSTGYVAASIAFSVAFAAIAMQCLTRNAARGPSRYVQLAVPVLLASGVVLLHFTGMTAMTVAPFASGADILSPRDKETLAVAVATVGLLVVSMGVISRLIDTSASQQTMQRLERLANFDALTGLPNRASLASMLATYMRRSDVTGGAVAVLAIDLDNFKDVNDLRGHEAGDYVLKEVAGRIAGMLGEGEHLARMGGDEFIAIKLFAHQHELARFVSLIEEAISEPVALDGYQAKLGASIGISIYPHDDVDPDRLVSNADLAMYRAKADHSRSVCCYEPAMGQELRERRLLAKDLRQSIERGELQLHYQVQRCVATDKICGYEALLRWQHTRLGNMPPSQFIPLAEETGFITEIGAWVLKNACAAAVGWDDHHKVAVNISPIELSSGDLSQRVAQVLLETGLPAERLELEITETSIIANKARTLEQLRRVRALGVGIAIDDFGTGYSSLDTLRSFPFDKIKLDRSFLIELEHSQQALAIFRAVMALGHSLRIPVLAEGVETPEQFAILKREGCDEAQGYLFGRPGPMRRKAVRLSLISAA